MGESKTTPETRAKLEAQTHIDIRKLPVGTELLIGAEPYLYELRVLNELGLVEVSSTDPRLKKKIVGIYVSGDYDADDKVSLEWRLTAGVKMHFWFHSCHYISAPINSARVIGKGYYYDVF